MDNLTILDIFRKSHVNAVSGSHLRDTFIDQQLHRGWNGFHNSNPCSPFGEKKRIELPY